MVTASEQEITFALLIANEHSSNFDGLEAKVARLQKANLIEGYAVIPTSLNDQHMLDDIAEKYRTKMVLFGGGGDGTTNLIGNALLSAEGIERGYNDIPFVPLRGGNANDIAVSLNGYRSIGRILKKGRQAGLRPLEISVNNKDPRYAFGYFSIGGTADAAAALHEMKGKYGIDQLPREIVTAWFKSADYPKFRYRTNKGDQYDFASDIMCLRADRIAKFGHPYTHLNNDTFEMIADLSGGRTEALLKMMSLGLGQLRGRPVDSANFTLATVVGGDNKIMLPVQYDGEIDEIPIVSDVSVVISQNSYTTLTTRF